MQLAGIESFERLSTIVDFQKLLKSLRTLPWKPAFWLLSLSFFLATLAANMVSILVMPDLKTPLPVDQGEMGTDSLALNKPTLTEGDLKIIYDRNIFNREGTLGDVDASKEEDPSATAQKSDLPLKLLGVIYGGTPFNGLATIENTQNNKINSFVVGDTLVRDAQVVEIHRTRVYLEKSGGRREYLELEAKEIVRSSRQKKKPASDANAGPSAIATGPALKNFREEGFERNGNEMTMSSDYRSRMLTQDFTKVLQDAKAVPNYVDGQIKGFKLERIRENSIYQKAGLQNDDIVEEINGFPLNDPGAAIRHMQGLRNESEIEVMVNRGGVSMTMKINVR